MELLYISQHSTPGTIGSDWVYFTYEIVRLVSVHDSVTCLAIVVQRKHILVYTNCAGFLLYQDIKLLSYAMQCCYDTINFRQNTPPIFTKQTA